jgi:hypothetical protein
MILDLKGDDLEEEQEISHDWQSWAKAREWVSDH